MRVLVFGFGVWGLGFACLHAQSAPPQPHPRHLTRVTISRFAFSPAELTISKGDTVVWANGDQFLHTTTADSGAWSSPEVGYGKLYQFVARQTGRFPYHCAAHPVMRGVIVVKE